MRSLSKRESSFGGWFGGRGSKEVEFLGIQTHFHPEVEQQFSAKRSQVRVLGGEWIVGKVEVKRYYS